MNENYHTLRFCKHNWNCKTWRAEILGKTYLLNTQQEGSVAPAPSIRDGRSASQGHSSATSSFHSGCVTGFRESTSEGCFTSSPTVVGICCLLLSTVIWQGGSWQDTCHLTHLLLETLTKLPKRASSSSCCRWGDGGERSVICPQGSSFEFWLWESQDSACSQCPDHHLARGRHLANTSWMNLCFAYHTHTEIP